MKNEQILTAATAYLDVQTQIEELEQKKSALTKKLAEIDKAFLDYVRQYPASELVAEIGGEYYLIKFCDFDDRKAIGSFAPIDLLA